MLEADRVLDRNDHLGICWDSNSVKIMNTHASSACTQFVLHTHTWSRTTGHHLEYYTDWTTTICAKIEINVRKGNIKKKNQYQITSLPASQSSTHILGT